jgi:hypothetical protein
LGLRNGSHDQDGEHPSEERGKPAGQPPSARDLPADRTRRDTQ